MQDVARLAGVSRMTVSYALRSHPAIPAATRERVLEAAREIGYRPNPLVSSLMAQLGPARRKVGGAGTLGLLHHATDFASSTSAQFMPGVRERAQELGYGTDDFFRRERGMTARRLSAILRNRGIRGLIIMRMGFGHLSLDWEHFCAVTHGYSMVKPDLTRVTSAHFDGMLLALRHAKQLGYLRPGLVLPFETNRSLRGTWLGGYTLFQHGKPRSRCIPPLLSKTPMSHPVTGFSE